jgi:membrane protease YdiL (CAAX protease family)
MNIGSYIAAFLMGFFEAFRGTEIANAVEQQISQSSPLVNVITAVVLAPIIEELLCRKWIIDRLMPYSEWAAALTSALFFGLIHGNFYQFFYAFLVGFLFAVVYIKTGNILHTILMHAIVNFTSAIVSQALSNQMESTLSISPWALMTGLYTIALYGLVVCGIFFLAHYVRRGKLEKEGPLKLPLSKQFSCIFLNWGTPILLLFCGALFFFSLFI